MIPKRVGDYEILDQLGDGGMGVVYRARHAQLRRDVALKILNPHVNSDGDGRVRFLREAILSSKLSHPNLVTLLDGGESEGVPFIAMELVEGETLQHLINRLAPISWIPVMALASRMAAGLAYLHSHQILHRDVKPPNVIISREGYLKLLDFGLARAVDTTVLTQDGSMVGTVAYLAPEIILGSAASPGSDLWSVGCILYHLATGSTHVPSDLPGTLIQSILEGTIVPPMERRFDIPEPVSQLILKLLTRDPQERLSSAAELGEQADALLAELGETTWEAELSPGILGRLETCQANPTPRTIPVAPPSQQRERITTGKELRRRVVSAPVRPAAPPKAQWSMAAAMLAFGFGLLLTIGLMHRAGPTDMETPPVSAAGDDEFNAPRPRYFSQWHGVLPYRDQLLAGGDTARRVVADLRSRSAVDMGRAPDAWLHWISLGEWLADPARSSVPHYADASNDLMDTIEEKVATGYLSEIGRPAGASLVASLVKSVGGRPSDGRCWLALGRVLEIDGMTTESRSAYVQALGLLQPKMLEDMPAFVWSGLAHALLSVPPHDLEKEWLEYIPHGRARTGSWSGLRDAIETSHPDIFERILYRAQTLDSQEDIAAWALGIYQLETLGHVSQAVATWEKASNHWPSTSELGDALWDFHGMRGHSGDIRRSAGRGRGRKPSRVAIEMAYLLDDQSLVANLHSESFELDPDPAPAEYEIFRLLEAGSIPEATQRTLEYLQQYPDRGRQIGFECAELLASGADNPRFSKCISSLLIGRSAKMITWDRAAGILSTKAGAHHMEQILGLVTEDYLPATKVPYIRALWLSRGGDYGESLKILAHELHGTGPPRSLMGQYCEILLRPVLARLLGEPVDAAQIERIRTLPPPAGRYGELYDALLAGDIHRAGPIAARCFETNAFEAYWALVRCQCSYLEHDPDWKTWAARLHINARYNRSGLWLLRAIPSR